MTPRKSNYWNDKLWGFDICREFPLKRKLYEKNQEINEGTQPTACFAKQRIEYVPVHKLGIIWKGVKPQKIVIFMRRKSRGIAYKQGATNSLPFLYQPCVALYGLFYALGLYAYVALWVVLAELCRKRRWTRATS